MDKKGCTKFSKKISIFLEHNFWPFIQFLLHFYALMFFRYQILPFFSFQKLKSSHTISFFVQFNSLCSLSVFLVRNSLSWNSLIPHSSWGIAMRSWNMFFGNYLKTQNYIFFLVSQLRSLDVLIFGKSSNMTKGKKILLFDDATQYLKKFIKYLNLFRPRL